MMLCGITHGRPPRVVIREAWDKAVMLAAARDEQEVLEQLVTLYAGFETEAEQAGRN